MLKKALLGFAACAALVASAAANPISAHERTFKSEDALDHYVFVPNRSSADIAIIDSRTDEVVAKVGVGNQPEPLRRKGDGLLQWARQS